MHPVCLTTKRLLLREFTTNDVDSVLTLVGDRRVTDWLSFDSRSRDQASSMITDTIARANAEPRTEYYLAVTLRADTRLIGFVRIGIDGVKAGKLGYAVRADEWGHGYATEATSAMLEFGFHELGLHRISAAIGPDNQASITVAKRLGMHYEGTIRDHVFTNGAWRDSQLY